ncbi:hypothetical protein [Clostridium botulinum]|nr:hypothetical protein [Clostridium botulinum]
MTDNFACKEYKNLYLVI